MVEVESIATTKQEICAIIKVSISNLTWLLSVVYERALGSMNELSFGETLR